MVSANGFLSVDTALARTAQGSNLEVNIVSPTPRQANFAFNKNTVVASYPSTPSPHSRTSSTSPLTPDDPEGPRTPSPLSAYPPSPASTCGSSSLSAFLSAEERAFWEEKAKEKKREHEALYPHYVYRPQRKEGKKNAPRRTAAQKAADEAARRAGLVRKDSVASTTGSVESAMSGGSETNERLAPHEEVISFQVPGPAAYFHFQNNYPGSEPPYMGPVDLDTSSSKASDSPASTTLEFHPGPLLPAAEIHESWGSVDPSLRPNSLSSPPPHASFAQLNIAHEFEPSLHSSSMFPSYNNESGGPSGRPSISLQPLGAITTGGQPIGNSPSSPPSQLTSPLAQLGMGHPHFASPIHAHDPSIPLPWAPPPADTASPRRHSQRDLQYAEASQHQQRPTCLSPLDQMQADAQFTAFASHAAAFGRGVLEHEFPQHFSQQHQHQPTDIPNFDIGIALDLPHMFDASDIDLTFGSSGHFEAFPTTQFLGPAWNMTLGADEDWMLRRGSVDALNATAATAEDVLEAFFNFDESAHHHHSTAMTSPSSDS